MNCSEHDDITTPGRVLHHQLYVTCCSLGSNVLSITHFDQLLDISKLICCDDVLTEARVRTPLQAQGLR